MILITSPAKTQDFESEIDAQHAATQPEFIGQSTEIADAMAKLSKPKLQLLLGVSDKLTELNYSRFQNWNQAPTRSAIHVYKGDIYRQFDAADITKEQAEYLQSHLRIITGMYGILRPYDEIKPYRLEMKTNIKILRLLSSDTLYEYWGDEITKGLNRELAKLSPEHRLVINLASNEYSKAINTENLEGEFIDITFLQEKDGVAKTIGIYSKQARGLFIKYAFENKITDRSQLDSFDSDGYKLIHNSKSELTFTKKV